MTMPPPFDPAPDAPVCVALSGGMDSLALLHALAANVAVRARGLRALHVDHGMHPDAREWAGRCEAACARLGLRCDVVAVHVDPAGLGREGAAREARHAAFADALRPGEWLAVAHHLDDQAETFLLRALRASGVDGLGAMSPLRPFAAGWMWRPWLGQPRERIAAYARALALDWIDDPSNEDASLDRVFLRRHVLPLLRERWPHAAPALAASAAHARDAAALLAAEDARALAACAGERPDELRIAPLLELPAARRTRVLRGWIVSLGLPPLPARGLAAVERDLLHARPDASPRFDWTGATLRAWGGLLHAATAGPPPAPFDVTWDGTSALALPDGGRLALEPAGMQGAGIEDVDAAPAPASTPRAWHVRSRRGGERIRLPGREHHHALKHLLQEARIPPWRRERLPLLVDGDEVLAAGDVVIGARLGNWLREHGLDLRWTPPAPRPGPHRSG
ncbi:MAG: tRNA lysidine(34) synthetase TilS [Pseudomonadota bacterium]